MLKDARKLRIDKNDTTLVYAVPVVFNIINEYGTENISDAQLMDQMIVLLLKLWQIFKGLNLMRISSLNLQQRTLGEIARME